MTETAIVPSKQSLETETRSWAARAHDLRIVDRESCINASTAPASPSNPFGDKSSSGSRRILTRRWRPSGKAESARKGLADEQARHGSAASSRQNTSSKSRSWSSRPTRSSVRLEEEQRLQAEAQRQAEAVTLAAAAALGTEAVKTGDVAMLAGSVRHPRPAHRQRRSCPSPGPFRRLQGVTYRDQWKAHPTVNVKAAGGGCGGWNGADIVPRAGHDGDQRVCTGNQGHAGRARDSVLQRSTGHGTRLMTGEHITTGMIEGGKLGSATAQGCPRPCAG